MCKHALTVGIKKIFAFLLWSLILVGTDACLGFVRFKLHDEVDVGILVACVFLHSMCEIFRFLVHYHLNHLESITIFKSWIMRNNENRLMTEWIIVKCTTGKRRPNRSSSYLHYQFPKSLLFASSWVSNNMERHVLEN